MQRALMWLNLYGCEAVQCKLKNSLKTHFLSVFELTLDSHLNLGLRSKFVRAKQSATAEIENCRSLPKYNTALEGLQPILA